MPPSLNVEITMLPRLTNALAKWSGAIPSLRDRLFRKTRESEQAVVERRYLVLPTKRVVDRSFSPTSKQPGSEFIRTQNQLMEAMIKSMILASGGNVDGTRRSAAGSQRSANSATKGLR